MASIQDVLSWRPGELSDIADAINRRRRTLRDVVDGGLPTGEPPDDWTGSDAGEAREAHRQLATSLEDGTSPLGRIVTALDTAATVCHQAKRDLEGLLDTARGRGYEVDATAGVVTDTRIYLNVAEEEDARLAVNQLADQLGDVLAKATAADETLAAALQAARTAIGDVGGDMAPVRRVRKLIREVDSGTITDPLAALQLPYTAYSKAGQKALAEWMSLDSSQRQVGQWLHDEASLSLPPSPGGYDIRVPTIEIGDKAKVDLRLRMLGGAGATNLAVSSSLGGMPTLGATLGDEGGASVSYEDHEAGASIEKALGHGYAFGSDWSKDGPWFTLSHTKQVAVGEGEAEFETKVSVRPSDGDLPRSKRPWYDQAWDTAEARAKGAGEYVAQTLQNDGEAAKQILENLPQPGDPDYPLPIVPGLPEVPIAPE